MSIALPVPNLEEIRRELESPHPSVLLVVGTGISFGASGDIRATWRGLLEDGIHSLEALGAKKESCDAALILLRDAFNATPFDLDEVLQRAQSLTQEFGKLGATHFSSWLDNSVGTIRIAQNRRETLDAIAELQSAGALILTTNYDNLLCEATGLEPVTWQQPGEILKIINRQRTGIIHIHGHWKSPSSIILGTNSYSQLVQATTTQTVFKTLWMTLHWVYLGCGSGGIDDPNLGTLLRWARETNLGESALTDYFLSTQQAIDALPTYVRESKNTIACAYATHDNLSSVLKTIRPDPRISPFELLGPHFSLVRDVAISPLDNPFPSWQEFQDGLVPSLDVDDDVSNKLAKHGWAFAFDVASVGKTTLALRIAARPEHRHSHRLYLSLKHNPDFLERGDDSPHAGMARAKQPNSLIIIDDAHVNPRLALQLWRQSKELPFGSRLLIIATSMDRLVYLPGEDSLRQLQNDPDNPPVPVRASNEELLAIAKYVLSRLNVDPRSLNPPLSAVNEWHRRFGGELGAFVISISQCREQLLNQNYSLPTTAAQEWIWARHLHWLSQNARANIVCLAAFGQDRLELSVPEQCLPHQDAETLAQLLSSTLIARFHRKRRIHYILREPGWSGLIRGALSPCPIGMAMIDALEKDLEFSQMFVQTLIDNQYFSLVATFYSYVGSNLDLLVRTILRSPLDASAWFLSIAKRQGYQSLIDQIWPILSGHSQVLTKSLFNARLEASAWFLAVTKEHNQQALHKYLWNALAGNPKRLAGHLFETSPEHVAYFLTLAFKEGEVALVKFLWDDLASEPNRLSVWILQSSPEHGSQLIMTAFEYGAHSLLDNLWRELSKYFGRISEWLISARMGHSSRFIKISSALAPSSFVDQLWHELSSNPGRLFSWACQSSASEVTSFIALASGRKNITLLDGFWHLAMSNAGKLALAWQNSSPTELAGILRRAPKENQTTLIRELDWAKMGFMKPNTDQSLFGAANLAEILYKCGRPDLTELLVDKLVLRKQDNDFGRPEFALKELSALLSLPLKNPRRIDDLLPFICTKQRLSLVYKKCKIQDLINSLYTIAIRQPPSVLSRLHHSSIYSRLKMLFRATEDKSLYFAIRLLGVCELIGLTCKPDLVFGVSTESIAGTLQFLPFPSNAYRIIQSSQFWLGLRVATRLVDKPIYVDRRTLQINLTSAGSASARSA